MSKHASQNNKKSCKYFIPIIIMMGFIPVIVHMYKYNSNLSQFEWFPEGSDARSDFFFAWKMVAIIAVGIVMGLILLYQYFVKKKELKFENSFYMLFFYLLFVGMSALFSPYKYWVTRGTYELFEPVWVVFAYAILCYYAYNFVQEEKQVDVILTWSGVGMAIVILIGVSQSLEMDFFKTNLGKHLITNPSWWENLDELSFTMEEGRVYTTLYNPNFLSFYFGMLIPLLLCLIIGAKKVWHRIVLVIAELLCLLCLKGSDSSSGWLALAIGFVIVGLVLLSRRKKLFYAGIAAVVVGIVAAVIFCNTTTIGQGIRDSVIGTFHMEDRYALNDVKTDEDAVTLNIRGNDLKLLIDGMDENQAQIVSTDAEGTVLQMEMSDAETQSYIIADERFDGITIQPILYDENTPCISVTIDGLAWNFVYQEDGGYYYLNAAGKMVKYEKIKRVNFFRDDLMSLRGYIWNNTIPLLGKHIFIGSGANTYMFEYPQNDYLRQYLFGQNTFDVKAHCWYLQQCVENGILGTLLLIGFLMWYFIQSVRIYRRTDLHQRISWVGIGLFSAVVVYMAAALANDSNVCTAPVFWGMLGLGLAVNRMLVQQQKLFVQTVPAEDVAADSVTKADQVSEKVTEKADTAIDHEVVPAVQKTTGKKQSRKQRKKNRK